MNPDGVEIKILATADRNSIEGLYLQAGWLEDGGKGPDGSRWIDAMVKGSFCFVGAFRGGEMIGMGRAISDGASDAYIQDVTVKREFRGRGIGARIVRTLSEELRSRGIGWIGLVAEPGSRAFYERLGFEPLEGYLPMRLKARRAEP